MSAESPTNGSDGLRAINIIDSYERGAGENGRRIVESLRDDDAIMSVASHVKGMRQAMEGDPPQEYFKSALIAANTHYELVRQGKEAGDTDLLMERIAKLNAAVLQLES